MFGASEIKRRIVQNVSFTPPFITREMYKVEEW